MPSTGSGLVIHRCITGACPGEFFFVLVTHELFLKDGATGRANKRVRAEDGIENFWENENDNGIFLIIKLKTGKPMKGRGWPWVQQCIRGILGQGESGKVAKVSFLSKGDLLVKTKNEKQTEKLIRASFFGEEPCEVVKDERLNSSKGRIYAPDLMELSEGEVVGWLGEFGVVAAKRVTKWVEHGWSFLFSGGAAAPPTLGSATPTSWLATSIFDRFWSFQASE